MTASTDSPGAPTGKPARPRRRRAWLGCFAFALVALSTLAACGASGSSSAKDGKDKGKGSKDGGSEQASRPKLPPVSAKDLRLPGYPSAPQRRSKAEVKRDVRLATKAKASDEQPNFLHILTDDQTIDSMKYMPTVKRLLRRRGTTFSQYHDVQPLCCPSRASFLSGQYPHNHGVLSNKPPLGGYGAMDFNNTLYTALDDAGYDTGWIGKVLNVSAGTGDAEKPAPGFDDWFAELVQPKDRMRTYRLSDDGRVRNFEKGPFQNDLFEKHAQQFLARTKGDPFMLTLSLFSPHWSPCPPGIDRRECPPIPDARDAKEFKDVRFPGGPDYEPGDDAGFIERYWRRELQALQSVDRITAALVKQLRKQGELANTYIIFQSDNGLLHGEHRLFGKNYPWDRSVRVPLVIRGPGFPKGENRADLTANVDVPATILDAAHVKPQRTLDGYSLLSDHQRKALLMERLDGAKKPGRGAWQQIKTASGYAYWFYGDGGHERLYDMRKDPYQVHNLVRKKPALVQRLRAKIERVKDCVGTECP